MQSSYASERPAHTGTAPPMSPWTGVLSFAGVTMLILGGFQLIEGLDALFDESAYLVTADTVIELNATVWGWTHLILGTITVATGFGILLGQPWARVTGILITAVLTLVHFVFLASAPLFSSLLIGIGIVVIYALAAHGRDVRGKP